MTDHRGQWVVQKTVPTQGKPGGNGERIDSIAVTLRHFRSGIAGLSGPKKAALPIRRRQFVVTDVKAKQVNSHVSQSLEFFGFSRYGLATGLRPATIRHTAAFFHSSFPS